MLSSIVPVVLAAALALLAVYLHSSYRKAPLPPGPKPLPLIGNLFDMPRSDEYKTYAKWGQYGDVVHVNVLNTHIVVLNSFHAASELLDARSSIYSDRPFVPMLHESTLMDSNWSFGFMQYSPRWKHLRRLFNDHVGPTTSRAFFDIQTSSTHTLIRSLLRTPDQFAKHLRHAAVEIIIAVAYGYQIQPNNDPLVAHAEYTVDLVAQGVMPGRYLVNNFPLLKYIPAWMPGTDFKKHAAKTKEAEIKFVKWPYEDSKRRMADGVASPSFVTNALSDPSPHVSERDIQAVASTMYVGQSDTVAATMHSCILALVLNPAIQAHAHTELDALLGPVTSPTFRLPTFADRAHLPYIEAILTESLRWLTAVPISLPHATIEDDIYRGWLIPKGTIVLANAWVMLHDKEVYPDPFEFRPERYLGPNPEPHPGSRGCFGFGRRECPGTYLAEASLWIQIASILSVFRLSTPKDKDGHHIDVSYAREPLPGLVLEPKPFPCKFEPRSEEAELRIREIYSE